MTANAPIPPRAVVEHLVRQAVYQRMGKPLPTAASAPNPLVVNVRSRHCHLTPDAVEQLFGKGHRLTVRQWLYQEGQFAAEETVTLAGPRNRAISNLRILGPCRNLNQVELAGADAIALGLEIPLRRSGNTQGAPGCRLLGPAGFFELAEGVIRAERHAHMHPKDAEFYGVKAGDFMKLRLGGECGLVLERVRCRVEPGFKLEVHIDTDEGNACNLQPDTACELFK
jgi:putative phosphotransacetylase